GTLPSVGDILQARRRIGDQRFSALAYSRALALARQILDRRLAIDSGEEQGRKQSGRPRFEAIAALPVDAGEIGARQRRKSGDVACPVGAFTRALEQKMIETEGKIEGGIAEPRAFGVEKHRSIRTFKDVLRADVAVNQSALRRERRMRELVEACFKLRVRAASRAQIGFDADRLERLVV